MIKDILDLQRRTTHLPLFVRALMSRDEVSLRAMSMASITAYLYGMHKFTEEAKNHNNEPGQQTKKQFFTQRQRNIMIHTGQERLRVQAITN
jgi:hypothetical protein